MTILFFDTETTGLIDFKADLMDPHQPRIVQLAAILTNDDGTELEEMNAIIKPDGWVVPDETAAIHGATGEAWHGLGVEGTGLCGGPESGGPFPHGLIPRGGSARHRS